jgi:hypothetical protein
MTTNENLPWRMMRTEMRRLRWPLIAVISTTAVLSVFSGMDEEFVLWAMLGAFGVALTFGRLASLYRRATISGFTVPELLLTHVQARDFAVSLLRIYGLMVFFALLLPAIIAIFVDGIRNTTSDLEMAYLYAALWLAMAFTLGYWASAFSHRAALTAWIGVFVAAIGWWAAFIYTFSAAWSGKSGILVKMAEATSWVLLYGTPAVAVVLTLLFIRRCFVSYDHFLRTQLT